MRRARLGWIALGALLIAGCGTTTPLNFKGKSRPTPTVNVSVYVGPSHVLVSPTTVSAGIATFNVTNQSGSTESVRVVPDHSTPNNTVLAAESDSIGPIPSGGTAQLTLQLSDGGYPYAITSGKISGTLRVTPATKAGNSALLQP